MSALRYTRTTVDALVNSFFLVFASEMGDKTQLLALVLAARFRKPVPIMLGILVATILNHALASYVGVLITKYISAETLTWGLGFTFIGFGLWILVPDKQDKIEALRQRLGQSNFYYTYFY